MVKMSIDQRIKRLPVLVILLISCLFLTPLKISAEVVTDGSVGPARSLAGPDYQIPHGLGRTAGKNLFHSFESFSLGKDQSATFTGPPDIANVISRVTGGNVSNIDGLLCSKIGRADFFFINPAGILFGENAQVDVPAAFHVSTADQLRFSDGAVFSASDPYTSTLTAAQPEAFGFLSPQSATITVNGSQLAFKPESAVSLSSSNLEIKGTPEKPASLTCEAGEIHLSALNDLGGIKVLKLDRTISLESADPEAQEISRNPGEQDSKQRSAEPGSSSE